MTWIVFEVSASRIEKNFAAIFLPRYVPARFVHVPAEWMRFLFVLDMPACLHRRSAVSRHGNRRYIRESIRVIAFSEAGPAGYVTWMPDREFTTAFASTASSGARNAVKKKLQVVIRVACHVKKIWIWIEKLEDIMHCQIIFILSHF